ncbi:MAG: hypothetical protein ING19_20695 [Azospirillum sp.]|nr:hypothetical protein [Azospirillum sp.]MCA3268470.1 hypothetical protein [Azospirillum sp.]
MPLFLSIVGWLFVVFGVIAWFGVPASRPVDFGLRGTIQFPSAIQETPVFLAIGFGFALVAAGAILSAMETMTGELRRLTGVGAPSAAGQISGFSLPEIAEPNPAAPARVPLPAQRAALPEDVQRMVVRMEAQGWRIEPQQNDTWHATRRGHTQVFSSLGEFRDWLLPRAGQ